ncbi:MAG: phosphoribosylformylglycinamidine synthase subunit PurQ [Peptoniphilus harei]|nr:phosphoribosylformylglycinamidine synthase subunit PurQ [Peptoniphilus harei]
MCFVVNSVKYILFANNISKIKEIFGNEQVALCYTDAPNGSALNVEAVMSEDGKILGKMGHSERFVENTFKNIRDMELEDIFTGGVEFFKAD